jgi:hypothetical protein
MNILIVREPSQTNPDEDYEVFIEKGRTFWCTCKDFQFRRTFCKHQRPIQEQLDRDLPWVMEIMDAFIDHVNESWEAPWQTARLASTNTQEKSTSGHSAEGSSSAHPM